MGTKLRQGLTEDKNLQLTVQYIQAEILEFGSNIPHLQQQYINSQGNELVIQLYYCKQKSLGWACCHWLQWSQKAFPHPFTWKLGLAMKPVLHPSSTLGPLKPTMQMWLLLLQRDAELYPRCVGRISAARGIGQQAAVLSTLVSICRQQGRGQDQE